MSFFELDGPRALQGEDIDVMLEEKFKYAAQDIDNVIDQDNRALNDMTFGHSAEPLGDKSDQIHRSIAKSETLEEIEAQMFRNKLPTQMEAVSLQQVEIQLQAQSADFQINQRNMVYSNAGSRANHVDFKSAQLREVSRNSIRSARNQNIGQNPISVNGIKIMPIEISNNDKNAVHQIFQMIMPLFVHIDSLIESLYEAGGDSEENNIRALKSMKDAISLQSTMFAQNIYIMNTQTVKQLHADLVQIFKYSENVLLSQTNGSSVEVVAQLIDDSDLSIDRRSLIIADVVVEDQKSLILEGKKPVLQIHKRVQSIADSNTKREGLILKNAMDSLEIKLLPEHLPLSVNDFPTLGSAIDSVKNSVRKGMTQIRPNSRQISQKQRKLQQMMEIEDKKINSAPVKVEYSRIDEGIPKSTNFNNLMLAHEKELMAKIQIAQLVSDDPFVDDYYFQMWKLAKEENDHTSQDLAMKGKKGRRWVHTKNQFLVESGAILSNHMQQQMRRLIETKKKNRNKETRISLEGTLGRFTKNTYKIPKQSQIHVRLPSSRPVANSMSKLAELQCIENLYDSVIKLDLLNRLEPEKLGVKELEQHATDIKDAKSILSENMAPKNQVSLNAPHPLACSLNHGKGLKIIDRALNMMSTGTILEFYSLIFNRLECLEVCNVELGRDRDKVESFMSCIFPHLTIIMANSDLKIINELMSIILRRHNLIWLSGSRVGLVIMTMILSQAEILKQSDQEIREITEDLDVTSWTEIYSFIFSSFESQFPILFSKLVEPMDEVYIWQFLSAMAVGASGIDHQRVLVTELRENIIQTSKTNHPIALENVNLFLTALGLNIDAAQLAAMS